MSWIVKLIRFFWIVQTPAFCLFKDQSAKLSSWLSVAGCSFFPLLHWSHAEATQNNNFEMSSAVEPLFELVLLWSWLLLHFCVTEIHVSIDLCPLSWGFREFKIKKRNPLQSFDWGQLVCLESLLCWKAATETWIGQMKKFTKNTNFYKGAPWAVAVQVAAVIKASLCGIAPY